MAYSGFQLRALALAGWVALGAPQTLAADYLNFPVESAPEFALRPVELGSGWYLRGALSASNNKGPLLIPEAPDGRKLDWAIDVGAGYKLNNWLRTDATLTFNKPRDVSRNGFRVTCPYNLWGSFSQTTLLKDGFFWDTVHDTCDPKSSSDLKKVDLMFNAYVDLGTWGGFTPFVGVGAGVSLLKANTSLKYLKTSDGSVYEPDLTPLEGYPHVWVDLYGRPITSWTDGAGVVRSGNPPVAFDKNVWSRNNAKTSYNLAWSLMGGVAYDVTPQLKAEFGYRYLNSGSFSSLSSPLVGVVKSKIDSHQMQIGFRYMID
jgi:opacity protein-like surface antigen